MTALLSFHGRAVTYARIHLWLPVCRLLLLGIISPPYILCLLGSLLYLQIPPIDVILPSRSLLMQTLADGVILPCLGDTILVPGAGPAHVTRRCQLRCSSSQS